MEDIKFDLVIVGAGCVGMASAYYAVQKGWKVCLIQQQQIGSQNRYWSSSFGARQNRVQYNEEYLTRYVVQSNKQWRKVQEHLGQQSNFLLQEGVLWFGDKNVNTSEGNIKASNAVINSINAASEKKEDRIESLYMDKLMQGTPAFMKAFKPYNPQGSVQSEWDTWSALYQPDGGSVNMKASYEAFYNYAKKNNVTIFDNTTISKYQFYEQKRIHVFQVTNNNGGNHSKIYGSKILLTLGIFTPLFLQKIMGQPYLADNAKNEYLLEQYVASYIKIDDSQQAKTIYDSIPNYINFVSQTKNIDTKQSQPTGYGFRYHSWDNPSKTSKLVKLGTMASHKLNDLDKAKYGPINDPNDSRIIAALNFARNRMTHLLSDDKDNVHYPCPIIFYYGRQTLLDYLNRTQETIVVQSGGWVGKYYSLLAKTAIDMLENPQKTQLIRSQNDVIGNFINRTRFPITSRINKLLSDQKSQGKTHFDNAIIGAGCSGLYSAYRLNKQKHLASETIEQIGNIGVFELSDRISGRLKSFKFQGATTPIELGGMRYIPTYHTLVNKIITDLGVPYVAFPMDGDPIQNSARLAFLRNQYYRMNQWDTVQQSNSNLHTTYSIEGPIIGMNAFQITSFSVYMILTAPENINLLNEVFLRKSLDQINEQKVRLTALKGNVHYQTSWYRDWKNYIYNDPTNKKNFFVKMSLKQWNQLYPILLIRFRYPLTSRQLYCAQEQVSQLNIYPLYKFGFQNVIQAQLGHQAYQFVSDQIGYYSKTTNTSYLYQVMTYLLDFGKVTYRTLASGFDQINYAMANILFDKKNGLRNNQGIFLNHKLVDILPGKDYNQRYVLVFHVVKNQDMKNKDQNYIHSKTNLNYNKQTKKRLGQKGLPKLGVLTPIEGTPDIFEIRFTANRVILGMPKKSVTNLCNQIEIFRKPFSKSDYIDIYNTQKQGFYQFFQYQKTKQTIEQGKTIQELTQQQKQRLKYLQKKQQQSFINPLKKLTTAENLQLQQLSSRKFIKSIQPVINQDFQKRKPAKFDNDPPIEPVNLLSLTNSAQAQPAIRVIMNFTCNWWNPDFKFNAQYAKTHKNASLINSVEEMRGLSLTDLPIRQTLYFSSGQDNMILASYNDMVTTEFWTALHDNFKQVWQPLVKESHERKLFTFEYPKSMDITPAKKVFVKEILKQLSLLHQVDVKQQWIKECIYQFWGKDPYGAGYHNFYSGYYIPSAMKCIRRPWKDQNIHIVGQAFSNQSGWVEGAFQTSELFMQQQLGLPELVKGYYPGY